MEDLFLLAHTESRKIFGTLIDGLFSSKEKVKNFIRLSGDPTNTYFVYLMHCDSDSHCLIFKGMTNDFWGWPDHSLRSFG